MIDKQIADEKADGEGPAAGDFYEYTTNKGKTAGYKVAAITDEGMVQLARPKKDLTGYTKNVFAVSADKLGKKLSDDPFLSSKFVEVIYAPSKLTADGLIERLVTQHSSPESILVITSDHLEQQTVSSSGAQFQSAEDFLINNVNNNTNYSTKMRPSEKPKLGDFFP